MNKLSLKVQGYMSSKMYTNCNSDRKIRWCVASNAEANKCGWIQAAASAVGVEPEISCIQQRDRKSAMQAVKDDRCDIFVAKPDEELHARRYSFS